MDRSAPLAEPFWFGPEGARLFGWYHGPAGPARGPAVLICPPLGYEMICAYRSLRHLAEQLAAAGYPTLRFDYLGTGDSAGEDTDPGSVRAWLDSVAVAAGEVRARSGVQRVALFGLRMGATLAATAAAEMGTVDGLILWVPFTSGRAYLRELRAFRLMADRREEDRSAPPAPPSEGEESAGFWFSPETVAELGTLDLRAAPQAPARRILMLGREDFHPDAALTSKWEGAGAALTQKTVPGYATMMVDAHDSVVPTQVIAAILEWLASWTGESAGTAGGGPPAAARPPRQTSLGQGAKETAVTFGPDQRLFGLLTEPPADATAGKTAILLLNPGAVHHIGSNRMYVGLARAWTALGFRVLRFDIGGIGDSRASATVPENHTYSPEAVGDVDHAISWLKSERQVEHIVLAGLCSGAHAAFHAALESLPVTESILINPITFYWKPGDSLDVSAWKNYSDTRHYRRSMLRKESWLKALRGEVDWKYILSVASKRLRVLIDARLKALRSIFTGDQPGQQNLSADLRRLSERGTRAFLLFSEGDPGLDYVNLNARATVDRLSSQPGFRFEVVAGADHTFTARSAQRRLATILTDHLAASSR